MALNREQHILDQGLLDGQLELWHNTFGYIKSMALKASSPLWTSTSPTPSTTTAARPPLPR
jgi:hypothetical protein